MSNEKPALSKKPSQTIEETIESHRESSRPRSDAVADGYEKTLNILPDELREYAGTSLHQFDLETGDYVSISKTNYESRVEPGADVLLSFGELTKKAKVLGTVREVNGGRQDDDALVVEVGDHRLTLPGYRVSGVFADESVVRGESK